MPAFLAFICFVIIQSFWCHLKSEIGRTVYSQIPWELEDGLIVVFVPTSCRIVYRINQLRREVKVQIKYFCLKSANCTRSHSKDES